MARKQKLDVYGRLARLFFDRWRVGLLIWVFLLGFGAVVYTSIIKREGFPPIQFPVSFVNGFYQADAAAVDSEIAQPFYDVVKDIEGVNSVSTTANDSSFTSAVFFDESISPEEGAELIRNSIAGVLPAQAQISVISIDPSAYLNKYDLLLSVYASDGDVSNEKLQEVATFVAQDMENDAVITEAEPQPLENIVIDPRTGEQTTQQTAFNYIGLPSNSDTLEFSRSIIVGVDRDKDNYDVIELSEAVQKRIDNLDLTQFDGEFGVVIGADFADSINNQIESLQSNLFTGLLAVALVSLLLITWRASIVTGLFMVTVMAVTVGVLYVVGYTLNTITLFGLVLALGLFVDDATIVVESIDAKKKKGKRGRDIVSEAVSKIGAASFSGTFTTVFVFLPLAFIGGVLGEFIRLLPITVIIALISSLILSLTIIPLLSRFILLRSDHISWFTKANPLAKAEAWLGEKAGSIPRLLKIRRRAGITAGVGMVGLSILAVISSFSFLAKVEFNIFPPSKDSDQLGITMSFPEGYSIEQAQKTSSEINKLISSEIGGLVHKVNYGSFSLVPPNSRSAELLIELVPFTEREEKSPDIQVQLEQALARSITDGTKTRIVQYDAGPPVDDFPLKVQVYEENPDKASELAGLVVEYLRTEGRTIIRQNGTTAQITEVNPPTLRSVAREDGARYFEISAAFNADDTSALLVAAEEELRKEFSEERLSTLGFTAETLRYDFGQESENAESFEALGLVFPVAIAAMFVLLAIQFRSLLQPLLIFMAIPFTFLGVFSGLYLTDNPLSFFVMVGLIGLIGIAVNNTILLTTYANQERADGESPIDAISNAVTKRFRPLITTTTTTIVALLPLALSDPFWEPLAYTIIFGLASSTFFVVISFPYYYLASEWVRIKSQKLYKKIRRQTSSA